MDELTKVVFEEQSPCECGESDVAAFLCLSCKDSGKMHRICSSEHIGRHAKDHQHHIYYEMSSEKVHCSECLDPVTIGAELAEALKKKNDMWELVMQMRGITLERALSYNYLVERLKAGKYKRIVVLTGAGISVSAGIPDFRSPGSGIYANL